MTGGRLSFGLICPPGLPNEKGPECSPLRNYIIEFCGMCFSFERKGSAIRPYVTQNALLEQALVSKDLADRQSFKWKMGRSTLLLYLLITSTDYYASPAQLKSFMSAFERKLTLQRINHKSSAVWFYWTLITDLDTLRVEYPPRIWKMTRAIYVLNSLSDEVFQRAEDFLLVSLMGPQQQPVKMERESSPSETPLALVDNASSLVSEILDNLSEHLDRRPD